MLKDKFTLQTLSRSPVDEAERVLILFPQLDVGATLCRMMYRYVLNLTPEGCLHINLLKLESFCDN